MAGRRDEWAGLFAELSQFCPRCGWAPARDRCPLCRFPTDVASEGPTLFLGRWVEVRRAMRGHRGIVVGSSSSAVNVLTEDGRSIDTRRDKVRLVEGAGPRERARCGAGEVLAAAVADDVPEGLHDTLVAHAIAVAEQGGVRQQRGLVRDAFALTDPVPIVDRLGFTVSERGWWRVVALWRKGRTGAAVEELLGLPHGRYPLRLAMLWQAAAKNQFTAGDRDRIAEAATHLGELSPAAEVAARLVIRAVADARRPSRDDELTAAAVRAIDEARAGSPWSAAGRWFRGEVGDAPRNRLVGALRSSPARLGADPAVLDAAPPEILDDLIDQAAVPAEWVDRADDLACGAHLLARTRIGMLDEDGLRRAGAVDELARRWARDGRGLPPGLPEDVRDRYAALAQTRSHDEASVLALAVASSVDASEVERALADPAALPAAPLLALPQLAAALVDRSAVDTTHLAADDLTDDQRQFVSRVLVRRSKAALQEWDLTGAEAAAVACLRFARDADCRDEALNLLAAVHWQRGDDGLAQAALGATRRQGEVDGLLVNATVVSTGAGASPGSGSGSGDDRRVPTTQLLRIADAATNAGLRAQAALAAASAIDDPTVQPSVVRALRTVARQPIPLDDFARVVMLLSTFDPAWLTAPGALEGAPHADSAPARAYLAWAAGRLDDHFAVLAAVLDDGAAEWAVQRRDQMVGTVLGDLRSVPERRSGALALGFALLRAGLPMDLETGIEARAQVVAAASLVAESADAEPHEDVVDWLVEAVEGFEGVADHARSRLAPLVSVASSELCRVVIVQRARLLARFEDLVGDHRSMAGQDLRSTARLGLDVCEQTTRLVGRLLPLVGPTDRRALDDLLQRCRRLAPRLEGLT